MQRGVLVYGEGAACIARYRKDPRYVRVDKFSRATRPPPPAIARTTFSRKLVRLPLGKSKPQSQLLLLLHRFPRRGASGAAASTSGVIGVTLHKCYHNDVYFSVWLADRYQHSWFIRQGSVRLAFSRHFSGRDLRVYAGHMDARRPDSFVIPYCTRRGAGTLRGRLIPSQYRRPEIRLRAATGPAAHLRINKTVNNKINQGQMTLVHVPVVVSVYPYSWPTAHASPARLRAPAAAASIRRPLHHRCPRRGLSTERAKNAERPRRGAK